MRKRGRYNKNEQGKIVKVADIYADETHQIDASKIDKEVFQIAKSLKNRGYEAYLVGGAVRDLFLGSRPKDFDIVTDAVPTEIRSIIRNSRIIGKRFRLVHVFYPNGKIIEVITFRSLDSSAHNPLYGTIEEDVQRRDFTINALYYDLNNHQIIDFVGSIADFDKRQMRNIIPLRQIFKEDPVRIIRCIKYAVKTGFKIPKKMVLQIRRDSKLIYECSQSRLTEELSKILCSEQCSEIIETLQQYHILEIILPCLDKKNFPSAYAIDFSNAMQEWQGLLQQHYEALESQEASLPPQKKRHRDKKTAPPAKVAPPAPGLLGGHLVGIGLSYLFSAYFTYSELWTNLLKMNDPEERSLEAYNRFKKELSGLNVANVEVSAACEQLFLREKLDFRPRLIQRKYARTGNPKRNHKKPKIVAGT